MEIGWGQIHTHTQPNTWPPSGLHLVEIMKGLNAVLSLSMTTTSCSLQHAFLHRQKTDGAHRLVSFKLVVSSVVVSKNVTERCFYNATFTYSPCYFKWHKITFEVNKCEVNLHSRMDLNGASGLWNPIGANLYSVVTVRRHPPQPIHLCKQVNSGYAVIL